MAKQAMSPLEKYIRMLERLGFRKVLEIGFTMPGEGKDRNEKFLVFFHKRDGLLLQFNTYLGMRVNDGALYYNWKRCIPEAKVYERRLICEGYWSMHGKRNVLVGSHYLPAYNVRAVLSQLRKNGKFLSTWTEAQRIRLTHYGDLRNEHSEVTASRTKMLPPEIRRALQIQ